MNFLNKCLNLCSTGSGTVTPGSYAYEGYKKIPVIKGFSDIFKMIRQKGEEGAQSNRKLLDMNTVIDTAKKVISDKLKIDDFLHLQP